MKIRNVPCPGCGHINTVAGSGYMGTAAYQCEECGTWFNLFGQELRPPEEWEEPIDDD